jgi:hypothetical protein
LEKLVNNQQTGFFDVYSILLGMQSGYRSGYGCVTASLNVLNDVTIALDSKQYCATIFIDLAKAFDKVSHSIIVGRLRSIGVKEDLWPCLLTSSLKECSHQGSTPRLNPMPYALLNLHQKHSLGSRKLSHPIICR